MVQRLGIHWKDDYFSGTCVGSLFARATAVGATQEVFQNTFIFHVVLWEVTKTVNSLTKNTSFVTRELWKLQKVVLCGRLALAVILALWGGTCTAVGRDILFVCSLKSLWCLCHHQNDQTLNQEICQMKTAVLIPSPKDALGPMSWSRFYWLLPKLKSWVYSLSPALITILFYYFLRYTSH